MLAKPQGESTPPRTSPGHRLRFSESGKFLGPEFCPTPCGLTSMDTTNNYGGYHG